MKQPHGYYGNPRYFPTTTPDYREAGRLRAASGKPREMQGSVRLSVLNPRTVSLTDAAYEQYLDGYIAEMQAKLTP